MTTGGQTARRGRAPSARRVERTPASQVCWIQAETPVRHERPAVHTLAPTAQTHRPSAAHGARFADSRQQGRRFKSHSERQAGSRRPSAVSSNGLLSRPGAWGCGSVVAVEVLGGRLTGRERRLPFGRRTRAALEWHGAWGIQPLPTPWTRGPRSGAHGGTNEADLQQRMRAPKTGA